MYNLYDTFSCETLVMFCELHGQMMPSVAIEAQMKVPTHKELFNGPFPASFCLIYVFSNITTN